MKKTPPQPQPKAAPKAAPKASPARCLPARDGWNLLEPIDDENGKPDFQAEPVIAWGVQDFAGGVLVRAITVDGLARNNAWLMRPDGSVTNGETDFADFQTLMRHVRGDSWSASDDPGEVRLGADGEPAPSPLPANPAVRPPIPPGQAPDLVGHSPALLREGPLVTPWP